MPTEQPHDPIDEGREPVQPDPAKSAPIKVQFGGTNCLGSSEIEWKLIPGVYPNTATIDVDGQGSTNILSGGPKFTTLLIDDGNAQIKVDRLIALYEVESPIPTIRKILLADQRFWWTYKHIERAYNIHRKVGVLSLQSTVALGFSNPTPDIQYVSGSLRGYTAKWTATQVLQDIFGEYKDWSKTKAVGMFGANTIGELKFDFDSSEINQLPIENLELDGNFAEVLSRVMDYLPKCQVAVDLDGSIRIYALSDGSEDIYTKPLEGHEAVGMGRLQEAKFNRIRPNQIEILFNKEFEIRFDSVEGNFTTDQNPEVNRIMVNVLPTPEWNTAGKAQGTWITFPEAFTAWGPPPGTTGLSFKFLCRAMVPYMDMWTGFLLNGQFQPNADWAGRSSAMIANYRRTFRLPKAWVDRSRSIKANRIAIWDSVSGARAPSPVYTDHCRIASQKTLHKDIHANGGADGTFCINMVGYPPTSPGTIPSLSDAVKPAPFKLVIIDEEQGIVQYEPQGDEFRMYEMTLPSCVEEDGNQTSPGHIPRTSGPTADAKSQSRSITFDSVFEAGNAPVLTSNHQSAIIVTLAPLGPNNETQLFKLAIPIEALSGKLPEGVYPRVAGGLGPPMQIKVHPALAVARYAWKDDFKDQISKAFLQGRGGTQPIQTATRDSNDIDNLLTNVGSPTDKGPSLTNLAYGIAASAFCEMSDHAIGHASIPLSPDQVKAGLQGYLDYIGFKVTTRGDSYFSIGMPEFLPKFDPMSFMSRGNKAVLSKSIPERGN